LCHSLGGGGRKDQPAKKLNTAAGKVWRVRGRFQGAMANGEEKVAVGQFAR
jgi:hypothetical protein